MIRAVQSSRAQGDIVIFRHLVDITRITKTGSAKPQISSTPNATCSRTSSRISRTETPMLEDLQDCADSRFHGRMSYGDNVLAQKDKGKHLPSREEHGRRRVPLRCRNLDQVVASLLGRDSEQKPASHGTSVRSQTSNVALRDAPSHRKCGKIP